MPIETPNHREFLEHIKQITIKIIDKTIPIIKKKKIHYQFEDEDVDVDVESPPVDPVTTPSATESKSKSESESDMEGGGPKISQTERDEVVSFLEECKDNLKVNVYERVTDLDGLFSLYKPIIESLCLVILCLGCDKIVNYYKVLKKILSSVALFLEATNDDFAASIMKDDEEEAKGTKGTKGTKETRDKVRDKVVQDTLYEQTPYLVSLFELIMKRRKKKATFAKHAFKAITSDPKHLLTADAMGALVTVATASLLGLPALAAAGVGTVMEGVMHLRKSISAASELKQDNAALSRTTSQISGDLQSAIDAFLELNIKCRLAALIYVILSHFNVKHPVACWRLKSQTKRHIQFITQSKFCLKTDDKALEVEEIDHPEAFEVADAETVQSEAFEVADAETDQSEIDVSSKGAQKVQRQYMVKLKELYGIKGGNITKNIRRNRKRSFKKRYQTHNRRRSKNYNVRKKLNTMKTKNMRKLDNRRRKTKRTRRTRRTRRNKK